MKILRSALKRGCTAEDIRHALATGQRWQIDVEPLRWLYVGVDPAARLLEIVCVEGDDGDEIVIHAMKLRKRFHPRGGRP